VPVVAEEVNNNDGIERFEARHGHGLSLRYRSATRRTAACVSGRDVLKSHRLIEPNGRWMSWLLRLLISLSLLIGRDIP